MAKFTFHELGHAFEWDPATRKVTRNGLEVSRDKFNLAAARKSAAWYVKNIIERRRP